MKCLPVEVEIRFLIRKDVPTVLAISAASPVPLTEEELINHIRQRNCVGMVIERDGRILGYMVYYLECQSIELVEFAVHPEFRRQGIGNELMKKLASKTTTQRHFVMAAVPESNLAMQLFLQSRWFKAVSVKRGYFGSEDGYMFRFSWATSEPARIEEEMADVN